eukprot:scaffold2940_cov63-Phaeocystis_antarctica.AAC.6
MRPARQGWARGQRSSTNPHLARPLASTPHPTSPNGPEECGRRRHGAIGKSRKYLVVGRVDAGPKPRILSYPAIPPAGPALQKYRRTHENKTKARREPSNNASAHSCN